MDISRFQNRLQIRQYQHEKLTVLELHGRSVDIGKNSFALYDAGRPLAEGGKTFAVDLTDIQHIDSSGLSALIRLSIVAKHNGGSCIIVVPRENTRVRDAFIVTRLMEAIPTYESLDAAQRGLALGNITPTSE